MTISVAMIVKDEERVIERAISCVSVFADEIVVVDTGSTDNTKQIASSHPKVKLFDSEFFRSDVHYSDFSFSIARNESIRKCSCEWIVWWDADDYIDEEGAIKIRDIAEGNDNECGYIFKTVSGTLSFSRLRMFRNGMDIGFDENHACHEYIETKGLLTFDRCDIKIKHVPCRKNVPSSDRNIAILEKDYYERGRIDPRTLFYLAESYRIARRNDDAIEFYDKYLEVSKWSEERFFARYFKAHCLNNKCLIEESLKEAFKSLSEDYRFAESYCLIGDLFYDQAKYEMARVWYSAAKEIPFPANAKLFVNSAFYGGYPSSKLKHVSKIMGVESDSNEKEVKGIRYIKDVRKSMGSFSLPSKVSECVVAVVSLSVAAMSQNGVVEIFCDGREDVSCIVDSLEGVTISEDNSCEVLEVPSSMSLRDRIEWYCRLAGIVISRDIKDEAEKQIKGIMKYAY